MNRLLLFVCLNLSVSLVFGSEGWLSSLRQKTSKLFGKKTSVPSNNAEHLSEDEPPQPVISTTSLDDQPTEQNKPAIMKRKQYPVLMGVQYIQSKMQQKEKTSNNYDVQIPTGLTELRKKKDELAEQLEMTNEEISQEDRKCKELDERAKALNDQLNDLVSSFYAHSNSETMDLTNLNSNISNGLQTQVDLITEQKHGCQERITKLNERVSELIHLSGLVDENIKNLNEVDESTSVDAQMASDDDTMSSLTDLQERIDSLTKHADEKNDQIKQLKEEIEQVNRDKDQTESEKEALSKSMTSLTDQIQQLEQSKQDILDKMVEQSEENAIKLENVQNELNQKNTELKAMQESQQQKARELLDQNHQIHGLQTKVSDLNDQVIKDKSQIESLKEQIEKMKPQILEGDKRLGIVNEEQSKRMELFNQFQRKSEEGLIRDLAIKDSQIQYSKSEMMALLHDIQNKDEMNAKLNHEFEQYKIEQSEERVQLVKDAEQLRNEIHQVKSKLSESEIDKSALSIELDFKNSYIESLEFIQNEYQEYAARAIRMAEKSMNEQAEKHDEIQQELKQKTEQVSAQLSAEQAKSEQLEAQLSDAMKRIEEMSREMENIKRENHKLLSEKQKRQSEFVALMEQSKRGKLMDEQQRDLTALFTQHNQRLSDEMKRKNKNQAAVNARIKQMIEGMDKRLAQDSR